MTHINDLTGRELLDTILPPVNYDGLERVARELRALHNAENGKAERKLLYVAFTLVDFLSYVKRGDKSASAEAKKTKFIGRTVAAFERYLKISGEDI